MILMKKILNLLIILAVCLLSVNFTGQVEAASPTPTCVITGYVDSIEPKVLADTEVEYYDLSVAVSAARLYSGQEYGDCRHYPDTDINLVYSGQDFQMQPILAGDKLDGKMTTHLEGVFKGLELWDVYVFPVNPYNFSYKNFDGIHLDDDTAIKGYTMRLFDESFLFGITPNLLTGGGAFEFKEVVLGENHGMDLPNGYSLASKIMEFDIKSKDKYDPARPFWLQVKYSPEAFFTKSIFYFDQGKSTWIKIPSKVNTATGYVRAAFHLPFAKLAVLENSGVMSEGTASWYAYKNCDCAASPDYPKGTQLKVTNIENGKSIVVTVNDWGPERDIFPDRVIDLDVVAFEKISNKRLGLCHVEVVPYYGEI
jgi:rare lipoprotein A (RlpA)-like double-psi beta-barrel protein